jgi:hypothetical protein
MHEITAHIDKKHKSLLDHNRDLDTSGGDDVQIEEERNAMLVVLDVEVIVAVLFNAMVSLGQLFFGLLCLQKLVKGGGLMLKLWPSGVPTADAFAVAHRVDKAWSRVLNKGGRLSLSQESMNFSYNASYVAWEEETLMLEFEVELIERSSEGLLVKLDCIFPSIAPRTLHYTTDRRPRVPLDDSEDEFRGLVGVSKGRWARWRVSGRGGWLGGRVLRAG